MKIKRCTNGHGQCLCLATAEITFNKFLINASLLYQNVIMCIFNKYKNVTIFCSTKASLAAENNFYNMININFVSFSYAARSCVENVKPSRYHTIDFAYIHVLVFNMQYIIPI